MPNLGSGSWPVRTRGFRQWLQRGFPGGANGKELSCQCRRHKRCRFDPWVGKISWRGKWQPTPVFLPGESHRLRSLVGYSPPAHTELDTAEVTWHTHTHTENAEREEEK